MRIGLISAALAALMASPAFAESMFDEDKPDPRCGLYGSGFTYSQSSGTCVKSKREVKIKAKFEINTKPTRPPMRVRVKSGAAVGPVELTIPSFLPD